jgi:gamma-glutamyltranspeptidase
MASTSHPLSTQAAVNILQNGGNAMDARLAIKVQNKNNLIYAR